MYGVDEVDTDVFRAHNEHVLWRKLRKLLTREGNEARASRSTWSVKPFITIHTTHLVNITVQPQHQQDALRPRINTSITRLIDCERLLDLVSLHLTNTTNVSLSVILSIPAPSQVVHQRFLISTTGYGLGSDMELPHVSKAFHIGAGGTALRIFVSLSTSLLRSIPLYRF